MDKRNEQEAKTTQYKTDTISELGIGETRQYGSPHHRTHSLNGIEHTRPVGCLLIGVGGGIDGAPDSLGDGIDYIGPHIEHASPAEELYKSYLPEGGRSILQQSYPVGADLLLLSHGVILAVLLRVPLLDLHRGVDDTEDEDGSTDIERPDDRVWHDTLRSHVTQADGCEDEWEEESDDTTRIAQERLDRVGFGLLLLVHHVAHKHLKRLHRHINTCVKQHEGYQAKDEGSTNSHSERAGIGQQAHDGHRHEGTYKQIRNTTAKACPCLIAQCSDNRLHKDTHKRWEDPKET